jgi:hypothetical protein
LDALDIRSMAAVYEQLHQLNSMRRPTIKRRIASNDIENVLRLTSSSKESWAEAIVTGREERL